MKKLISATILVFLVLSFAKNAFAYRIGDVDVNLLASAQEIYDDNILYSNINVKKDYSTNFAVGISGTAEGKTRMLTFKSDVKFQRYARFTKFDNVAEDLHASLSQDLSSRSGLNFTEDFTHAEEPHSFEDQFGGTQIRYDYYINNFGANFTHEFTKQFSILGKYYNQFYSPNREDLINSFLNDAAIEADYAITSKSILLATTEYLNRKFENSIDIGTTRYAGGLRQYFSPQFYVEGRIGQDFAESSDKQKHNSMYYQGTVSDDIDVKTNFSVAYLKQDNSTFYMQEIFKSQRVSVSLKRNLLKRLNIFLSGFYGTGDYTRSDITTKFIGGAVNFSYDILPNIQANIAYSYSKTNSNLSSWEYNKNLISLGLNGEF